MSQRPEPNAPFVQKVTLYTAIFGMLVRLFYLCLCEPNVL